MNYQSLTVDELKRIKSEKQAQNEKLNNEIIELQKSLQEITRDQERKEESMMNNYKNQIEELKRQNRSLQSRIEHEENCTISKLYERYKKVLKEKEELQFQLQREEGEVIENLQFEISNIKNVEVRLETQLSQANHKESDDYKNKLDLDLVDEELNKLLQQSEKTKNDYEKELMLLTSEIEKYITANSILSQRIAAVERDLIAYISKHTEGKIFGKIRRYSDVTSGVPKLRRLSV